MTQPDTLIPTLSRDASLPSRGRTFARRRLHLGITGVGATVILAAGWLWLLLSGRVALPASWRVLDGAPTWLALPLTAGALVFVVYVAHALLLLPVEFAGGTIVTRERPSRAAWGAAWLRGVAVLAIVASACAAAIAAGGVAFGAFGLVAGVACGAIALLAAQGAMARAVAALEVRPADATLRAAARAAGIAEGDLRVIRGADSAFVGGWIGLWRSRLWIPARWLEPAHRAVLDVQLVRREYQQSSGARGFGLWSAALWPAAGTALLVPSLPWAPTDATFWLALPAVSTLWSFVGALVLPSATRRATYAADAAASWRFGRERVIAAIRVLDLWQDDEAERPPAVEAIFHPVPARGNRERALYAETQERGRSAHQQARLALYAALAAGSVMGRVVHCNAGRPTLWVVYPGD